MNTTGSFHNAASATPSKKPPMLDDPSPKKQRVTRFSPRYLHLNATPDAMGTWPPTMPYPPRKLLGAANGCIEPPRPLEMPRFLPESSAMIARELVPLA